MSIKATDTETAVYQREMGFEFWVLSCAETQNSKPKTQNLPPQYFSRFEA